MRGDITGMLMFFVFLFLGAWQLLIAWHRLSGLSLTGYPDRRCFSMVLGAVLVSGSCSWYFSAPGHFASPDVEGFETFLVLTAGLLIATALHLALASLLYFARRVFRGSATESTVGLETTLDVDGRAVPALFKEASPAAGTSRPVLLLHDYGGGRGDLGTLASALSAGGCASLSVQLDGHGDSPRDVESAGMEQLLAAACEELRRRSGGATPGAVGVGLGGTLAMELFRRGAAAGVVAMDPPALVGGGERVMNVLRELAPPQAASAFLWPPVRGAGGARVTLSRLLEELCPAGELKPGKVIVVGTAGCWVNAPDQLEAYVRSRGVPGTVPVDASHRTIAGHPDTIRAVVASMA